MMLLDQSLERLVREGAISKDDAFSKATDIESMLIRLKDF